MDDDILSAPHSARQSPDFSATECGEAIFLNDEFRRRESGGDAAGPCLAARTVLPITAADVHKRDADNIWLSAAAAESDDLLVASFCIPPLSPRMRFVELMEIQRQVGMLQAHRQLGVPLDEVIILNKITLVTANTQLLSSATHSSRRGKVRVRASETRKNGNRTRGAIQHFRFEADSGLLAHGLSMTAFVGQPVYERLRHRGPASGAGGCTDRFASSTTRREPLSDVAEDPITSDHALDHVSAMQTACAVERSVTGAHNRKSIASLVIDFESFAELHPVPMLVTSIGADGSILGALEQDGRVRASFSGWLDHAPIRDGGSP